MFPKIRKLIPFRESCAGLESDIAGNTRVEPFIHWKLSLLGSFETGELVSWSCNFGMQNFASFKKQGQIKIKSFKVQQILSQHSTRQSANLLQNNSLASVSNERENTVSVVRNEKLFSVH